MSGLCLVAVLLFTFGDGQSVNRQGFGRQGSDSRGEFSGSVSGRETVGYQPGVAEEIRLLLSVGCGRWRGRADVAGVNAAAGFCAGGRGRYSAAGGWGEQSVLQVDGRWSA